MASRLSQYPGDGVPENHYLDVLRDIEQAIAKNGAAWICEGDFTHDDAMDLQDSGLIGYHDDQAWITPYGRHWLEARDSWNNNELQFARLLCEIVSAEELLNWPEIRDSMDLSDPELQELFDRAHSVFEAAKPHPTSMETSMKLFIQFNNGRLEELTCEYLGMGADQLACLSRLEREDFGKQIIDDLVALLRQSPTGSETSNLSGDINE